MSDYRAFEVLRQGDAVTKPHNTSSLCRLRIFLGLAIIISSPQFAKVANCAPQISASWENPGDQPELNRDYFVTTSSPGSVDFPNVELKTGSLTWRVWSSDTNNAGEPGDIGVISSPWPANFGVQLQSSEVDGSIAPGARNIKGITLVPTSSGNYSSIIGGTVAGNLEGALTVQPDGDGMGGAVSLRVEGTMSGNSTINNVVYLFANKISGTIGITKLTGGLQIVHLGVDGVGSVNIQTAYGATSTGIAVTESFSGSMSISEVVNDPEVEDDLLLYLLSGISPTGLLSFHDMGSATIALVGPFFGANMAGTIDFFDGISSGSVVRIDGRMNGEIDLHGVGVSAGAQLKLLEGGGGSIVNGGSVEGRVLLGIPNTPGFPDDSEFSGTATFESASSSAEVTIYGTGTLEFTGNFSGNLCGTGLSGTETITVPSNIHIAGIGSQGRVCGTTVCGALLPDPSGLYNNRFISFSTSYTRERAIRVRMVSLHDVDPPYTGSSSNPCAACPGETCAGCEGQIRFVGPPALYSEHSSCSSLSTCLAKYVSVLQCTPHYQNWSTVGLLRVRGSAIMPSSEYEIEMMLGENAACFKNLGFVTNRWGDVVVPFTTLPDMGDVAALVSKYKNVSGAPDKARCMLAGIDSYGNVNLDVDVDFSHIGACVDAFKGKPYPYNIQVCP